MKINFRDQVKNLTGRKISWGAIFAGALVVVVTQIFFGVLGISFGAASINPQTEQHPMQGFGIGLAIWVGATTLLTLFAGGWVAARLSGASRRIDGVLHGVVGWSLATVATLYLMTSVVGGVLKATSGLAGNLLSLAGQGAAAVVKEGAEVVAPNGVDLSDIKKQATKLLSQTRKAELQPKAIIANAEDAVSDARQTANDSVKAPQSADNEVEGLIGRLFGDAKKTFDAADKTAAVNIVMARGKVSRAEAQKTVDQWETSFQQAKQKFAELKDKAEVKAREAGQTAANATSKAAAWTAIILFLGFVASSVGGFFGAPSESAEPAEQRLGHPELSRPIVAAS